MIDDARSLPLLEDLLDESKAQHSLQTFGFVNWKSAYTIFRRMASRDWDGLSAIYTFLMMAIRSAADPDRTLINFERFMDSYGAEFFQELVKNPRVIEILTAIFSASPFLTETILRTPDSLELLNDRQALTERKTIEQFQNEAILATLSIEQNEDKLNALRRYQRRQFLRIGACDFLSMYDLRAVFSQLSRMAIGLVRACLSLTVQETGIVPSGFVVMAMGKLGGWELNYSSDIDLVFVARRGAVKYIHLAEHLIADITSTTSEGFLYRVDLRLRPWGSDGPLITTSDSYLQYIQKNARLWEKQAFLKARPIAGNLSFGEELRKEIEPYLFRTPANEVRESIFAMKQQTEEMLQEKGRYWGEVKLGQGSIRDIEFIVQSLQMIHPSVRTRATLKAIFRLRESDLLSPEEAHILSDGYNFLRTIEHYLQMIDYRQTYTLPSDPIAIALLARRFGFEGHQAADEFVDRYEKHCQAIRSLFMKYVGDGLAEVGKTLPHVSSQTLDHIARMDSSYVSTFSAEEIQQHAYFASTLNHESIAIVDTQPLDETRWRVTVVGYDYLGELSLICGLMFVYGLDIIESQVFTYEPIEGNVAPPISSNISKISKPSRSTTTLKMQTSGDHRIIVDVFTVRSIRSGPPTPEMWIRYADELHTLLLKMQAGQRREARGELAKRVGEVFLGTAGAVPPLYPIDIEIDNEESRLYTVLKINTQDTVGFLYEFSNALALNHINIARMFVMSTGNRVNDTIYVTDDEGNKITSSEKQRELRAAIVLIKHFTHLLPHSPNPEAALLHFREFLAQLFHRLNWPDELAKLEKPEFLDAIAKLLGVSDFLWDDFLRMQYPNLFPVVRDVDALKIAKKRQELQDELKSILGQADDWRAALNAFKDREIFRIDMRHILGYTPEFWDFAYALTDLVDVVVTVAFNQCVEEMSALYGEPRYENGDSCPVTLLALGKCGGRELGFASDIELMLIYGGKGKTTGPNVIPTSDYFEELVQSFEGSILARREGIFHIDLQLRPYGKAGSLAVPLDAFHRYYAPQGPAWAYERQALMKLRPITGNFPLGEQICSLRDEFVYNGEPFNVTAMRAMREKQIRHLVTAGTFNAKYSPGGLVDLEYLVQGLQITYGAANPALRLTNTRMAMTALSEAGIISMEYYVRLRKAHTFLRWLIDSLRVVRGNTKDVNIPPVESEEYAFLARRLQYGSDTKRLQEDLSFYPMDVLDLNTRLLG